MLIFKQHVCLCIPFFAVCFWVLCCLLILRFDNMSLDQIGCMSVFELVNRMHCYIMSYCIVNSFNLY